MLNALNKQFRSNQYIERKWVKHIRPSDLALEQPTYPFQIDLINEADWLYD